MKSQFSDIMARWTSHKFGPPPVPTWSSTLARNSPFLIPILGAAICINALMTTSKELKETVNYAVDSTSSNSGGSSN
jgi:hypothetical protein